MGNMPAIVLLLVLAFTEVSSKHHIVCFDAQNVNERGVDVAIYDFADFCEKYYNYTSKILIPDTHKARQGFGLSKYVSRFKENVVYYQLDEVVIDGNKYHIPETSFPQGAKNHSCEFVYTQKAGAQIHVPRYPQAFDKSLNYGIHAVFSWDPHGDLPYAAISPDVTGGVAGRKVVPLIVRPPSSEFASYKGMRSELKISEKAFVICRHGGMQTFDLPFVHHAVFDLLAKYSATQLEFIFLGTQVFENRDKTVKSNAHPQIHHLGTNTSIEYKENFIASCDAMLHARHGGETFGLAVAEFSIRNKPVITFPGGAKEHIHILGEKGFIYHNAEDLFKIVDNFVAHGVDKTKDYNAYRDYLPEKVMALFKKIFLDPAFHDD